MAEFLEMAVFAISGDSDDLATREEKITERSRAEQSRAEQSTESRAEQRKEGRMRCRHVRSSRSHPDCCSDKGRGGRAALGFDGRPGGGQVCKFTSRQPAHVGGQPHASLRARLRRSGASARRLHTWGSDCPWDTQIAALLELACEVDVLMNAMSI